MTFNEIVNDILKKEDDQMARVFTMTISSLLISKGIQPIAIKSLDEWSIDDDDINKYVMRNRYKCTFDIDTSKHDAKVRADAINECCKLIEYAVSAGECKDILYELLGGNS